MCQALIPISADPRIIVVEAPFGVDEAELPAILEHCINHELRAVPTKARIEVDTAVIHVFPWEVV